MVESSLRNKLAKFPKMVNKDVNKLFELSVVLSQIESAMEDPRYAIVLSSFNSSIWRDADCQQTTLQSAEQMDKPWKTI